MSHFFFNIGDTRAILRLSGKTQVIDDKVIIRDNGYGTALDTRFSNRTGTVFKPFLVFFRLANIFSRSEALTVNK